MSGSDLFLLSSGALYVCVAFIQRISVAFENRVLRGLSRKY